MIYHLVQINFISVILCVFFAIYILVDRCFDNRIRLYFFSTVVIILILIIIDDIEYVENKLAYPTTLRYIGLTLGYMIRPIVAILVTAIFAHSNAKAIKLKSFIIYMIPFWVNFIALVISIWTGCVYSLSVSNEFVRGPIGYITFVVGFLYMGLMIVVSLQSVKIRKKGESFVVIMLGVLCVVGTMLESWFLFVGFLAGASIVGVVLYYLYLHVAIYSIDSLTGAYNRRIFELDVQKIRGQVIFASMDLNHLKEVNDTYGHNKGDEFISLFASEVMKNMSKMSHLYRVGGDEFVMMSAKSTEENVRRKIEAVQSKMNKHGYSFAYGIKKINHEDDIKKMIEVVDQMMYENKTEMKRNE